MLKYVSLFPILQSHAGFLHLLTSYLQKLAFMVCRSKCQNQAKEGGWGGYGWDVWSFRDAHEPFGFLQARSLQWLVSRLSGVCKAVSNVPLMSSEPWLLCSHSPSEPISLADHLSNLGEVRKWASGPTFPKLSWTAGEARCFFTCSCGLNCRLRRVPPCCAALGKEWCKQGKNIGLTLVNASILRFFCSSGVLELLHWTPRLSQRYSCSWVMAKIYVLWGNDSRELIFCHLTDVTLKYFGFRIYTLNDNARLPQMNEFKSNTMQKSQNKLKTKINPIK